MKQYKYIPKNSTEIKGKHGATVYTYEDGAKPCAIGYRRTGNKSAFHFAYRTPEDRTAKVTEWLKEQDNNYQAHQDFKAERADNKKNFRHSYQPGDILYSSWGYDQTNVEFYQVISTTEKQITFREITQHSVPGTAGYDCCSVLPNKDDFKAGEKEYTRTVQPCTSSGKGALSFAEYEGGMIRRLWEHDGRPKYCSWYG
jgi:hypothetical protein